MKITDVKAVYPRYRHVQPSWRTHLWQIVVRVETDAGVVGLGCGGGGLAAVEVANGHFRELLLGRRIETVEDIRAVWDSLYAASLPYGRKGIAVMALSGVDLALWDLLGRAEQLPVHALISRRSKGDRSAPTRQGPTPPGTPIWGSPRTSSFTGGANRRTTTRRSRPPLRPAASSRPTPCSWSTAT